MAKRIMVRLDDLTDAHGVAAILGLAHRNTVSEYQATYQDMPRPVIDLGTGRCKLWLRSEIDQWHRNRAAKRARDRAKRQRPT
jgi:glutathione-regulated potassium-efflux system ancillary protein KefG